MAEKQETVDDIIAEKRRRADEIERDCAEKMKRGEMISDQYTRELVADIRKEADRLEAAYKREKAAIEADALAVGGIVEAMRQKEAICTKCRDGEPPEDCRFFGEPDGCNSPTYGHYPQLPIGDCAKMREALEYVLDFDATDDTAMEDGLTDGERVAEYADHIEECQKRARAALAAPPRNCDVGTAEEQAERYGRHCDKFIRDGMHCEECPCCGKIPFGKCEFAWAQTPYEEGGAK